MRPSAVRHTAATDARERVVRPASAATHAANATFTMWQPKAPGEIGAGGPEAAAAEAAEVAVSTEGLD